MGSIETAKSHFKKIQNFKADYTLAEFTQYESQRTGMRVVVVDRKGPKVYGYFALATEIHDDSGAPHTLEHLCFMGSRRYPYKGVLDKIATRAYSDTNAWTDTAETVYSLHTAGWEGFAQILPIYLDHVVVPTITDAGCYTEVHHVDGTGHDAGVVYAEMQGRENLQGDLMELQMRRHLYPEGDGFRYETGGMTEALRVLTAERIREFHREMYQPKNLRLVLIGEVDHDDLLDILDKFEDGILDYVPAFDAPFTRPWVDSKRTPPLSKTIVDFVEFPEEDESMGEIMIGFLGPEAKDDLMETAVNAILTYLAGSSVSVLVNTLVEKEQLCSTIYFWVKDHFDMVIWITLASVETEKLEEVEKRFFEVLREHASQPLDMEYLKDCLTRFKRQITFAAEVSSDDFKEPIIKDHLFGARDGSDLYSSMATLKVFEELEAWTEEDWRTFLKKWISDAHHVSILGKPSLALSEKIKSDEVARIEEQKKRLGEEGMKNLAKKLEEAKAENDKSIPNEIIESLKVPGTESIHFFETTTARSGLAKELGMLDNNIQKIIDKDENGLPLFVHYEHIPTSFVYFSLSLGTASVPVELKPLLGVYLTNFFATPIETDGKRIEFEEVTTSLEKDTIEFDIDRGSTVGNSELLYIHFVVDADKFEIAVKWLSTMLVNSVFDQERLIAAVTKMLADVPEEKRDGNSMAFAVDRMIHYAPSSSVRATNTLVKAVYLKRLCKLLKSDPAKVISMMESLRKYLLKFSNMRILTIANLETLPKPVSTFSHLTSAIKPDHTPSILPIDDRKAVLSNIGRNPGSAAYIVPLPIDSSFAVLTSKGPDSYTSPQLPALMVALAYLDAVEGPMWSSIRGTGLAYGTRFYKDLETGLLKFTIYKSPNAFSAYATAKKVVGEYVSGEKRLENLALEGAISSIVREFVDEKATIIEAAKGGYIDLVIRGVGKDWSDWVLKEVRKVEGEQVKQVLRDVVANVFEPGKTDLVVTCGGLMVDDLKEKFEEAGFQPQVKSLTEFQDGSEMEE
ncbi:zinc metalloprotease-like protein [Delitschia confertaspora ATCC 74209]|uniref:Zinc metalloprotease-like protein n=1 Tax=Delitschia confertaspora ATCC 74209 TaxID=1513339 RepID=A0A9P4JKN6_9PLEO|nr:zinc metalloprotease-like protein [Delitschia confertaspora ATCC 74209]